MEQFITHFGYWGIFIVLIASGLGLPFPEDVPLLFGGYLCSQDIASLHWMLPFTFITVLGADLLLYTIGRRYGQLVPQLPFFRRFLTPKRLLAAEMAFRTHGGKALFTSRFVPGIRSAIFFTAGVCKVPLWKFLLFDGSAALISVPLLVLLGYFFSSHLDEVRNATVATQLIVGTIVLAVIGLFVWRKWRRNKMKLAQAGHPLTANPATSSRDGLAIPHALKPTQTPSSTHLQP